MRRVIAAFLLVFAVGAITMTSTAFAGEWDVNGTKLTGTAALLGTALALAPGILEIKEFEFVVSCAGETVGISGGQLVAPDTLLASSFTLKECTTPGESGGCIIENHEIIGLPVQGKALLAGSLDSFIELLPKTKTALGVFYLDGEDCAINQAEFILVGGVDLFLDKGRDPETTHRTLLLSLNGRLLTGTGEDKLTGPTMDLRLASGGTWNFL